MEKCYEYFGCNKKDCVMYKNKDKTKCWDVQGTLCNHPGMKIMDKNKCKCCIYYEAINKK